MRSSVDRQSDYDFDSLPPALRRKFFSSLERLRLAQDGTLPSPSLHKDILPCCYAKERPRPSISTTTPSFARPIPCLRKPRRAQAKHITSQADTQWFCTLPPKIQQKHFSREEQILLAGAQEAVILDATDEALYRLGRHSSCPCSRCRENPCDTSKRQCLKPVDGLAFDSSSSEYGPHFSSFRWVEEEDDSGLSLDDYHTAMAQTAGTVARRWNSRPPIRHSTSMSSMSPRRSSASSHLSPSLTRPSTAHPPPPSTPSRPVSTLLHPHRKSETTPSSIGPSAAYYQDPEARLKLRVYLASAQKFDEALEFGFPAIEHTEILYTTRPAAASRHTEESERTFLIDDSEGDEEDDDENELDSSFDEDGNDRDAESSIADSDGPCTPQESSFPSSRRSSNRSGSNMSGILQPHGFRKSSEPYAQAYATSREMTLHMTLTPPDLRNTDERLSPRFREEDPYRLADLPFSDDGKLAWDSFPSDGSKLRKMLRRLRVK